MKEKTVFFIDFDGTITLEDVCYRLIKNHARKGWEQLNDLWESGELSTVVCARETLKLLTIGPAQMEEFCHQVSIDPTFLHFVAWAQGQDSLLYVLSDGYANYIETAFRQQKLELRFYANQLYYNRGWHIRTPYLNEECQKCGVCKSGLMEQLAGPGYKTVYIGDGYSDLCPAPKCDLLFAKNKLAALCDEKGIPYYTYKNFRDIISVLEKMI